MSAFDGEEPPLGAELLRELRRPDEDARDIRELLEEEPVELDERLDTIVIVDGLPVVDQSKFSKLLAVINKRFSQYGTVVAEGTWWPQGEDGDTLGFAFYQMSSPNEAMDAAQGLNGVKLDKKHTLKCNMFNDVERFASVPDEYKANIDETVSALRDLNNWELDEHCREMFFVRYGEDLEIYFQSPYLGKSTQGREIVTDGSVHKRTGRSWTSLEACWSSKGAYLATFHLQGIVLWGGEHFSRILKMEHADVRHVSFSPEENYMITCNFNVKDPRCFVVWDLLTGKELRSFPASSKRPMLKFSADDKYVARLGISKAGREAIMVYELPECKLLDAKSIEVPHIEEFEWSPTGSYIAFGVPEHEDAPARISVMEIPSRNVIRDRHVYKCTDIKVHWHPQGTYLAVKMARKRTKKTTVTNYEIFRMSQKNVAVETLEISDAIIAFAWEPHGHHFVVVHESSGQGICVSFYLMKPNSVELYQTLTQRQCNSVFWSPEGRFVVLAGLGSMNGVLEFYDIDTKDTLATREHFMANTVSWDPSGRFVMTAVCQNLRESGQWRYAMENGYSIWTHDGKNMYTPDLWARTTQLQLEKCYQVMWRPRPSSLLSKNEKKQLLKQLKERNFYKRFEQDDERVRISQQDAISQQRYRWTQEWNTYRRKALEEAQVEAQKRRDLRDGMASDEEDYVVMEEEVEIVLSEAAFPVNEPV